MIKWEYKTLKIDPVGFEGGIVKTDVFERELNRLGSLGWELVSSFDTNQDNGRSREILAIFKKSVK